MSQLLIGLVITLGLLFGGQTVFAQEEAPRLPFDTPTPNPATPVQPTPQLQTTPSADPTVTSGQVDQEKIDNLRQEYFLLLEQYRTQEQSYSVAKAQYVQLNTLASQELAVQETKKLIDIRADVFFKYLAILEEMLQQTKGVPLENKSPQLVTIRLLKEAVLQHKNVNNAALDRFTVDQESIRFQQDIAGLETNTYYTLSLIRVGRVQHALDKLELVATAVHDDVTARQLTSAQKAQKERGFAEIEREINIAIQQLTEVKQEVYGEKKVDDLSNFTSLTSDLSPIFADMNQIILHLQEIRK